MRIDHHDVALRSGLADPVEDQRGGGRLAGAGRAEQCEVLAQQRVDVEPGRDVAGRKDRADLDRRTSVAGIDLAQVTGAGRIDQRTGDRIARHAAAERVDPPGQLFLFALTQEVDVGEDPPALGILSLGAHAGQQPAAPDPDLDLAANLSGQRHRGIVVVDALLQALRIERDHRR